MEGLNTKLTAKDILEKEFRLVGKGYSPEEVDSYLDMVMDDYNEYARFTKYLLREYGNLQDENANLKAEIRKLKMEVETLRENAETGKFASTNVDVLKRLSNLEKIVYERTNNILDKRW